MNVYKKLQIARLALQEKKLTKSGKNKFAGYEYFELQDFIPAVQTIFSDTGLCPVFRVGSSDATLTIYNTDNPEEYVLFTAPMAAAELKGCHPVQNLGASISYLRRYLYVNALEIVEHDALDATVGSPEPPRQAPKPMPKPEIVEARKPVAPVKQEQMQDWQIRLSGSPDSENWKSLVSESAVMLLHMAKSEDDVMTVYKRNKQVFEQLKTVDAEHFKELMDKFTQARNKLKEAA